MVRELTNEEVIDCKREKRMLLNNILRRKVSLIGRILRTNCLLHDPIEGQMTEVKEAGRRRTKLLNDLRNKRYWGIDFQFPSDSGS